MAFAGVVMWHDDIESPWQTMSIYFSGYCTAELLSSFPPMLNYSLLIFYVIPACHRISEPSSPPVESLRGVKPRAYATGETTNRESPIGRHLPHREMTIWARYLDPLIGPPNSYQPLSPRVGASGADRRTICPHFNEWIFYLSVININIP
jgi:hypothetical protein